MCGELTELPSCGRDNDSAYIIDSMAMIQALNEHYFKTFDDLAEVVLKQVLRKVKNASLENVNVTVVFDRYLQNSIKSGEREQRGGTAVQSAQTHKIIGTRNVPNFRNFLKVSGNKSALVMFVSEYIMRNAVDRIPCNKTVVVAGGCQNGERVVTITDEGVEETNELYCSHEEADTRMILHAVSLRSKVSRVVVRSDDTDVLVLLLYYKNKGLLSQDVYMHAGHSGKYITHERYIPVHTIAAEIGDKICQCLPSAHALTGCDSTNALLGIGKKTVYTTLKKQVENDTPVVNLGNVHCPEWMESARTLVLRLYGSKGGQCKTLDDWRYVFATTTDKPAAQLPPTEDAFHQHASRAIYQTLVWSQSHVPKPEMEDPVGHGWYENDGLQPVLFKRKPAQAKVRDLTHLFCTDGDCKDGTKCTCVLAGIKYIEICGCDNHCPNAQPSSTDFDEEPRHKHDKCDVHPCMQAIIKYLVLD